MALTRRHEQPCRFAQYPQSAKLSPKYGRYKPETQIHSCLSKNELPAVSTQSLHPRETSPPPEMQAPTRGSLATERRAARWRTPDRLAARSSPARVGPPSTDSPRPERDRSTVSAESPDPRSDSRDSHEEASWTRMNRRRAELVFKKNRGVLNDVDRAELERLQALSRSRMQREFPAPTLIDEKLERIEARLRDARAKKA